MTLAKKTRLKPKGGAVKCYRLAVPMGLWLRYKAACEKSDITPAENQRTHMRNFCKEAGT